MEDVKIDNLEDNKKKGGSKSAMSWAILVIVVIIIGGYFMYQGSQDDFGFVRGDILKASLQSDSDEIVLDEVTMPEGGGFVLLYEMQNGIRVPVGRSAYLPSGVHKNVAIPVSSETKSKYRNGGYSRGSGIVALAYEDTNRDQTYNEDSDEVLTDEAGNEIVVIVDFGDETDIPDGTASTTTNDDSSDEGDDETGTTTETEADDTEDTATTTDPEGDDDGDDTEAMEPETVSVLYDGSDFSPNPVTIKVGETVSFENNGENDMWVASAEHPSHEELPGFDQNEGGAPGTSYEFIFEEAGEWDYHDHLNPQATGTIIVE